MQSFAANDLHFADRGCAEQVRPFKLRVRIRLRLRRLK